MSEFREDTWKLHGMDYRSPLKRTMLRLGKRISEMSCLEVYIETELDRRNLPEEKKFENI